MPLDLKWMLLWEAPLSHDLTLCKGTPRAWLRDGGEIAVRGAHTSLGRVSFNVSSRLGDSPPRVLAYVRLVPSARGHADAGLLLRLRVPSGFRRVALRLDGQVVKGWAAEATETVSVPRRTGRGVEAAVEAVYVADTV